MAGRDKEPNDIREMSPDVAGHFYPSDPAHLMRTIDTFLREAELYEIGGKLRALMVPHAGYIYSGPVAARGYRLIRNLDQETSWRVIIIGLSHYKAFSGISIGDYSHYNSPLGTITVSPLAKELLKSHGSFIPEAHKKEHSIEVQLPFLKGALKHFEIVPILTSNTNYNKLADIIKPHLNDTTILIVSSDLSHMLPFDKAEEIDNATLNWIVTGDENNLSKRGQACGLTGILTMVALSNEPGWNREIIGYSTSADTHGEMSQVVGYGCVACWKKEIRVGEWEYRFPDFSC